jgi:pyruvate/2-oxoglutarate dehydrogenase complex dihydrolipoamide dehydrogenase (E3) component
MAVISAAVERYDAVIIGSGQGGKPLAHALAGAGRRTVLVERRAVGGSCVNFGCTPTQTMIASARVAHLARRARDFGVDAGPVRVDALAVRARKRHVVERFREGARRSLEETSGLELLHGHARFCAPDMVELHGPDQRYLRLSAPIVVIDTGTRPMLPSVDGLDAVPYLDSGSVQELEEVPEHLLILGGGYIAVEYAQMFRRFGARVCLVEQASQLLQGEDEDVARAVADLLREEGVEVLLDAAVRRVERVGDRRVRLHADTPAGEHVVTGSHLLVAAGRRPNTDDLGLAEAGVATDEHGFVKVDARLATSVPGVYAIGDVTGGPAFTHVSYDHFRVLKANLIDGGDVTTEGRLVPYVVFTDPELGRVGLTERDARAAGGDVRVAKMPMSHVARAIETGETRGFLKAVVDGSGRILGVAVLGAMGGELMSALQIAMMAGLPYTALRDGVFAHPTFAESLNNLFADLGSRS